MELRFSNHLNSDLQPSVQPTLWGDGSIISITVILEAFVRFDYTRRGNAFHPYASVSFANDGTLTSLVNLCRVAGIQAHSRPVSEGCRLQIHLGMCVGMEISDTVGP